MRVALSGTPGTGKTSVASLLKTKGYTIVSLNDLAINNGFVVGVDKKRDTKLIDIPKLNTFIKKKYTTKDIVFIEGHSTHLLKSADIVIILRCHPRVLTKRLQKKGWKPVKIKENVDAEILDIILCEAMEIHPAEKLFEIDTTQKTIMEIATIIVHLAKNNFRPTKTYSMGQIDWSEEILKEYLS